MRNNPSPSAGGVSNTNQPGANKLLFPTNAPGLGPGAASPEHLAHRVQSQLEWGLSNCAAGFLLSLDDFAGLL